MKTLLGSLLVVLSVLSSRAAITGQWDFDNGDLSATIGSPCSTAARPPARRQFGSTTVFGIANDWRTEWLNVMRFPADFVAGLHHDRTAWPRMAAAS